MRTFSVYLLILHCDSGGAERTGREEVWVCVFSGCSRGGGDGRGRAMVGVKEGGGGRAGCFMGVQDLRISRTARTAHRCGSRYLLAAQHAAQLPAPLSAHCSSLSGEFCIIALFSFSYQQFSDIFQRLVYKLSLPFSCFV